MNVLKLLSTVSLILVSCTEQKKEQKPSEAEIKSSINSILTNWHKAATDANYKGYMDVMDTNSIYIGTDATENWTKKEFEGFCKPYFDEGSAWDFKLLERNVFISTNKSVVWFDETLNTWMGTCIGSGILEQNNGTWKLKHYTLSIAVPNDDLETIIKIKSKSDSTLLKKYNAKAISMEEFDLQTIE